MVGKEYSPEDVLTFIEDSNQRCRSLGLNPNIVPNPILIESSQLKLIQRENKEVLDVVEFFIPEFLGMVKGTPLLIVLTDHQGVVMYIEGDNTIKNVIEQLGFKTGVQFAIIRLKT